MNEKIEYLTVTQINKYIKYMFDEDSNLNLVYLKGEISNFKNHTTGHLYFTLKDDESRINAVMFASSARNIDFKIEDGMNVLVEGRVSAYPVAGSYQIYVDKMSLDGLGNLYLEYEKLKKELAKEGLFNPEFKKIIPKYPERIGVITAPTGAAVKDIISTIKRRFPSCEVILFPSLVQGKDAAPNIVKELKLADSFNLDTIIIGRGGGSIEDLWAFNEEIVARAIFAAKTPIISAVGHEIDFTIADFVADLRAPTPTGAAEMAVPTVIDTQNMLKQYELRLNKNIKNYVNTKYIILRNIKNNYVLKNPLSLYEIKMQKLDGYLNDLNKNIKTMLNYKENDLNKIKTSYLLKHPEHLIDKYFNQYEILRSTLKNLNPLDILGKGYSVVKKDDNIIKNSDDLKINDIIDIRFSKGNIRSIVKEVTNGKENI